MVSCLSKRKGAAYGILSTGSSLGGVIFPILVHRLTKQVGYPWTMRIAAFLIFGLLAVANLAVKARLPPKPLKPTPKELLSPFKEASFLLIVAGSFFVTFGVFVPITYLPSASLGGGMSPDLAQYLLSILNAGSVK